jgi:hypothetical protein
MSSKEFEVIFLDFEEPEFELIFFDDIEEKTLKTRL